MDGGDGGSLRRRDFLTRVGMAGGRRGAVRDDGRARAGRVAGERAGGVGEGARGVEAAREVGLRLARARRRRRGDPRRRHGRPRDRVRARQGRLPAARSSRRASGPAVATGRCAAAPRRPRSAARASARGFSNGAVHERRPGAARAAHGHARLLPRAGRADRDVHATRTPTPTTTTRASGRSRGTPIRHRTAKADVYGYVSELLAKATDQGALDGQLTADDKERLLAFLRNFGAIGGAGDRRRLHRQRRAAATRSTPAPGPRPARVLGPPFGL